MDPTISMTNLVRSALMLSGASLATKFGIDGAIVPTAVSVFMGLGGAAWSAWARSKTNMIASVAALPEVRAVLTTPEIANSPQFKADDKVVAPPSSGSPDFPGSTRRFE